VTTAIALFNNKSGVGRTTLTYHLASMVASWAGGSLPWTWTPPSTVTIAASLMFR